MDAGCAIGAGAPTIIGADCEGLCSTRLIVSSLFISLSISSIVILSLFDNSCACNRARAETMDEIL